MNAVYYAHSKNKADQRHLLKEHLQGVSRLAGVFADGFPWPDEARLAGLLHDLGKYGDRFQKRLLGEDQGLDHWSQGAWLALSEDNADTATSGINASFDLLPGFPVVWAALVFLQAGIQFKALPVS